MASSADQFSHPLGMGGYRSSSGWQILEMAIIWKEWLYSGGMKIFGRNDNNKEGMPIIWKEWQSYERNDKNREGMT